MLTAVALIGTTVMLTGGLGTGGIDMSECYVYILQYYKNTVH